MVVVRVIGYKYYSEIFLITIPFTQKRSVCMRAKTMRFRLTNVDTIANSNFYFNIISLGVGYFDKVETKMSALAVLIFQIFRLLAKY